MYTPVLPLFLPALPPQASKLEVDDQLATCSWARPGDASCGRPKGANGAERDLEEETVAVVEGTAVTTLGDTHLNYEPI